MSLLRRGSFYFFRECPQDIVAGTVVDFYGDGGQRIGSALGLVRVGGTERGLELELEDEIGLQRVGDEIVLAHAAESGVELVVATCSTPAEGMRKETGIGSAICDKKFSGGKDGRRDGSMRSVRNLRRSECCGEAGCGERGFESNVRTEKQGLDGRSSFYFVDEDAARKGKVSRVTS